MAKAKTILLVEDDPFLVDIYTTKFKEAGFDITVAADGNQAIKMMQDRKFDLVLLDIVLPHLDGWEVLEKVKADPNLQDQKVVVLSNLGQKQEIDRALALGANKYLIKAHYTPSEVAEEARLILD